MPRLYLGLAIHNHQPVGNFDWVFRDAYQRAYLPFLAALERHPHIRLSLHYSGPLLEWLRGHEPGFIDRLRALVERGQVELMGGGYYEPILSAIPDADKLGQIRRMRRVLEDWFGRSPTGLWLAERVWEPHLPRWLAEAGVDWTVLDDAHFQMVGLSEDDLDGYYVTEEQGQAINLFGTSQVLRHIIPFRPVPEVLDHLQRLAAPGEPRLVVMGDDGEKFGVWPDTYRLCWHDGWVDEFFQALAANASWLETISLGDFVQRYPPKGRIYIPTASYAEMMEWALPVAAATRLHAASQWAAEAGRTDVQQFLHGGFWRVFLVKYPEANAMHKKMLLVHEKVQRAGGAGQDALWRAQCNCPYWHGIFGGVYMNDVRVVTYQNLVLAEREAEEQLRGREQWLSWRQLDYDCDGWEEVLIEGSPISVYLSPRLGGGMIEWDWLPQPLNLLATLTRRPEAYHQALLARQAALEVPDDGTARSIHALERAKEPDLASYLVYDRYRRLSLLDHFLPADVSLASLQGASYEELGDFLEQPYQWTVLADQESLQVRLWRDGLVRQGSASVSVSVEKELRLERGAERLEVRYRLRNRGSHPVRGLFASEWNLNLLGGGGNPLAYARHGGAGAVETRLDVAEDLPAIQTLVVGNHGLGTRAELSLAVPARLWRFPIETISNSESGFERVHQGFCLMIAWAMALRPSETWQTAFSWRLSSNMAKMS